MHHIILHLTEPFNYRNIKIQQIDHRLICASDKRYRLNTIKIDHGTFLNVTSILKQPLKQPLHRYIMRKYKYVVTDRKIKRNAIISNSAIKVNIILIRKVSLTIFRKLDYQKFRLLQNQTLENCSFKVESNFNVIKIVDYTEQIQIKKKEK